MSTPVSNSVTRLGMTTTHRQLALTVIAVACLGVVGWSFAAKAQQPATTRPSTATSRTSSPTTAPTSFRLAGMSTTNPTTASSGLRNLATMPLTRPPGAVRRTAPQLPREYAVFFERSLFKIGRQRIVDENSNQNTHTSAPAIRPQASIVFNGVVDFGGSQTAFIEDMSAGKVQRLKVGDVVAGGKITRITLDSLDYEHEGKTITVSVGQNLDGVTPAAPTYTSGYPSDSTGASSSGSPPAAPGSVAERMRIARLKALGQLPQTGAPGSTTAPADGSAPPAGLSQPPGSFVLPQESVPGTSFRVVIPGGSSVAPSGSGEATVTGPVIILGAAPGQTPPPPGAPAAPFTPPVQIEEP